MWNSNQYQLIDFGSGRKLEQFGFLVLDRPCPAAANAQPRLPDRWKTANIRLDNHGRVLAASDELLLESIQKRTVSWAVDYNNFRLNLRLTPFGHVGVFPEQASNWDFLQHTFDASPGELQALNLFAYSGGTTLALARQQVAVVHVDASAPTVHWARENAEASELQQAPIRWIVEDALKFVSREVRRNNSYDIIVLDPPSYGHGPKGKNQSWRIERDLKQLVDELIKLTRLNAPTTFVYSAHSESPNLTETEAIWRSAIQQHGIEALQFQKLPLFLTDLCQRKLDAGYCIRATLVRQP